MPITYRPIIPKKTSVRKLQRLQQRFVLLMGDFVTQAHDDLATYPPARAESAYRRTGTLGRSWQHRVIVKGDRIEGVAASQGQIAPYNVSVQGPRQKPIFKARGWKTPKDVLGRRLPAWKKRVRDAIKEAAR